ncbi:HlyD family efflux transporter periplasmic adaptor subunit [Spirulina major CS-329]|uniref:HlyD family secretion protein n=1 Tax=Spirulina TaxID=1154 RepID=UPI00232EC3F7|nr:MULTISPECIES: HlyD family efflux transporter periplasmic adaptor subunit [Spirulina]MDB9494561.1 HlyD family efflux transporter periplasmic adaptor subunit [Spirulina subsalsa CS-330]MDB9503997.1 HlyD family efflux transporter periplasmic adaptor subunit [Spirulina major CS-329]
MTPHPQNPDETFQGKPQFQAVPPRPASTPNLGQAGGQQPPPRSPQSPAAPSSASPYQGLFILGAIAVTLGLISQISSQPSVRAEDAWLEPLPQTRRTVYAQSPGVITDVFVQSDGTVEAGQPLVLLESEVLEADVESFALRSLEAQTEVNAAQQNVLTAQAQVQEIAANLKQAEFRFQELEREIAQLEAGSPPPEIASYDNQIQNLQARVANLDETLANYQFLERNDAITPEQVREIERQKLFAQSEMDEVAARRDAIIKRMEDEWKQHYDRVVQLRNSYQVARQDYQAAQNLVANRMPMQQQLHQQLLKREQREQERAVLAAPMSGTVVTQDLHKLAGRVVREGDEVLDIVDPQQLRIRMQVKQEDRLLIKEGAVVTFSLPEQELQTFTGTIEQIGTVVERDEQLNRSLTPVIAIATDQPDGLQPGARVYAKIESPKKMTLGQQAWRQILTLFRR